MPGLFDSFLADCVADCVEARDPNAGLCRCPQYSQPHDHEWTGDECEHEYWPYPEWRAVGVQVLMCKHCPHEQEIEADP